MVAARQRNDIDAALLLFRNTSSWQQFVLKSTAKRWGTDESCTDWLRLIATCWQSVYIYKLDCNYLQALTSLSESDWSRFESDCLDTGCHGAGNLQNHLRIKIGHPVSFWNYLQSVAECNSFTVVWLSHKRYFILGHCRYNHVIQYPGLTNTCCCTETKCCSISPPKICKVIYLLLLSLFHCMACFFFTLTCQNPHVHCPSAVQTPATHILICRRKLFKTSYFPVFL